MNLLQQAIRANTKETDNEAIARNRIISKCADALGIRKAQIEHFKKTTPGWAAHYIKAS